MILTTPVPDPPRVVAVGDGSSLHALVAELFPICRSVAGPGVRQTLALLGRRIPLEVTEVPSGTRVFDWTVPKEWRIRDAHISDPSGRRVVDFRDCNLHVVNYSIAVDRQLTLQELRPHLHADPARPDVIPYRTAYYRDDWGFCLRQRDLDALPDQLYRVKIDADHVEGALTYGECVVPGASEQEVLVSAHICHPSLANDNLSGVAVAAHLAMWAAQAPRRFTYRFLFAPATIGALCWLDRNFHRRRLVRHGLVLTLLGDEGGLSYKRSRRGDAEIDRAAMHVLAGRGRSAAVTPFTPFGYDERQYGSPGFDLPVGRLMRTPHEKYIHYHGSGDNLEAVTPKQLADSFAACVELFEILERNLVYRRRDPFGEPQLGRRGLYSQALRGADRSQFEQAVLWMLNQSDGRCDLLSIAERSQLPPHFLHQAAVALAEADLLEADPPAPAAEGSAESDRSPTNWRGLAHRLIPGGAHTYAKGDDQFPACAPAAIERGLGSHVWDVQGREYIEFGAGLRSVTLGHAFAPVVEAVTRQLQHGANFTRPSRIEIEAAAELLEVLPGAEMVKFAKNASDCTTAAVKLARACTGRDYVAFCRDQPFFSTDDWFIGATPMAAGVPRAIRSLSLGFPFNDPPALERLFAEHPGKIACVILEPATVVEPHPGYLEKLQSLCAREGAVLIFDETITGFRWRIGGGQEYYGVTPDLAVFGKALGNGFAAAALVGKRELMERGGLRHSHERVFLLSTTHGAETHTLAAVREVIGVYRREPVIETLWRQGERLKRGVQQAISARGLDSHVRLLGPPCNLVYETRDTRGERSQAMRTLFLQELVRQGILAPSLVVSYSHSDSDIDRAVEAIDAALAVYARALADGVERYLQGPPVQPVFRTYNENPRPQP